MACSELVFVRVRLRRSARSHSSVAFTYRDSAACAVAHSILSFPPAPAPTQPLPFPSRTSSEARCGGHVEPNGAGLLIRAPLRPLPSAETIYSILIIIILVINGRAAGAIHRRGDA